MTVVLIFCLVLAVFAKSQNHNRFREFISLVANNKYFITYGKSTSVFTTFNVLLLVVQILSASLFFYLLLDSFRLITGPSLLLFIQISAVYTVFIGLKFLIEKFIGLLFSMEKTIAHYLFQKLTYRNLIGLGLVITNFLLVYTFTEKKAVSIVILCLALLANTIALFHSYKTHEKTIKTHSFYFILYLCALEILPYFILYKVLV